MPDAEKVLSLKAQRAALQSKIEEWETKHATVHGRTATAADRQRSREHRELSRLLVDLDGYIASLEGGDGGGGSRAHALGTPHSEQKAERGRVKAKMRRWEREFERKHGRKPTEGDIEASTEMTRLRGKLRREGSSGTSHASRSSAKRGPVAKPLDGLERGEPDEGSGATESAASFMDGAPVTPGSSAADAPPAVSSGASPSQGAASLHAPWSRSNEYHDLLRSRVSSQQAVNGFAGVSLAEAHAAAESFAAWDLDRDGVLTKEEFLTVLRALAEEPLDQETQDRLFALVDSDESGAIDFNEWLAYFSRLSETVHGVTE